MCKTIVTVMEPRNYKNKSKNNCGEEKSEGRNDSNSKAKTSNTKSIQLGTFKGEDGACVIEGVLLF